MKLPILTLIFLALAVGVSHAQGLKLENSNVGVGATNLSGGNYTLQSFIGQPITTTSAGGNFSMETSSVSLTIALQTEGSPTLFLRATNGVAILSWNVTERSYVLEESPILNSDQWQSVPQTPIVTNGMVTVTISVTPGTRFFRLR